ncbi:hypothetical protein CH35J_012863 [Colletotrichum higginsianum]|uniref:Uncharacterized protein n=1 Tax=Colletotrichum higginsianum TaxID=80884 RepID=A0A4T0VCX0_9PEZI|nr:hypothetical protein CH35J_012863 [Colletotrichum higginsianum]
MSVPLDLATATIFVSVDGSFANKPDLSSPIGFVFLLANEKVDDDRGTFEINGNIVHCSSTESKCVTRSVLASKVHGMVAGADMAVAIPSTMRILTRKPGMPSTPTVMCTDSYSLHKCLVKLGTTQEKRLMIDIMALRQSYDRREPTEVGWIDGRDNPVDATTKRDPNPRA